MARIIEGSLEDYDTGLFDSDTDEDLLVDKVVDITEHCLLSGNQRKILLVFVNARCGRVVQIRRISKDEDVGLGIRNHFFVDELEKQMHVDEKNDIFGFIASRLGLDKHSLRRLIEVCAPA